MIDKIPQLPEYPKVELMGSTIIIRYEDGSEEVWGNEPNNEIAAAVAGDIQLGLQAIDYVSLEVAKRLNELAEELMNAGVPLEYTNDYICEGYGKIAKWFKELEPYQVLSE
ncbi:hypothetical protein KAI10_09675 [Candidatus Bathyarchaeota archaeon]|nr:hypothetical protein [Candidatus Bathyarchaeota archaeon]